MRIFKSSLVFAGLLCCADLLAGDVVWTIVARDLQTGTVTVRDTATDLVHEFQITNQQLLEKLNPGTTIVRTGVTGPAVSPDEVEPDWADVVFVFAPDSMNKGELVGDSKIATPEDWQRQHSAVNIGTANLPKPDDWTPTYSLAPGVTLQVLSLKRLGTRAVKLEFSLSNGSDTDHYLQELGFGARSDLSNLALIDYDGGMKYGVVTDSEGLCECSRTPGSSIRVLSGQNKSFFAHFTAPPRDVDRITINIPNAVTVDNVPIDP